LGGADKLAAVKDLQLHADLEVITPGASMKVKQTTSFMAPSTFRQDNELPFMKQSVYSDGGSGWIAGAQGVQNLPPPVLKQIRGEAFRQIASLALSDRDANRAVSEVADGVLEISTKDGESVRITVDEKTGLPAKLAYQQSPAEGGTAVEEIYSEWRDVDGLHLPFQWSVMQGGKKFAGVTVQDYKINSGLTAVARRNSRAARQARHRRMRAGARRRPLPQHANPRGIGPRVLFLSRQPHRLEHREDLYAL
jgi:hypothetical protein